MPSWFYTACKQYCSPGKRSNVIKGFCTESSCPYVFLWLFWHCAFYSLLFFFLTQPDKLRPVLQNMDMKFQIYTNLALFFSSLTVHYLFKYTDKDGVCRYTDRKIQLMSEYKMGELMHGGVSPDRSCISPSDPKTVFCLRCRGAGREDRGSKAGAEGRRSDVHSYAAASWLFSGEVMFKGPTCYSFS